MYNFNTTPDRTGRGTIKFDAREEVFGRGDVIPLWIADMDFECAPAIREAICRRAEHNLYGYDIGGERCAASVRGWLSRRGGWDVSEEWLRFSPGVVAGLGFAIRAFTEPGDGVVIQTPVYPPFRAITEANGRRVVTNPLRVTDAGFGIDFEDLERKFQETDFSSERCGCCADRQDEGEDSTERTDSPENRGGATGAPLSRKIKAIILCNPHNPVGRVFRREELQRLGELCVKYDVTIISDEIHSDLVFKPHKHIHIASLDPRFAERCVTFVAPSKTFNIAGLGTSVVVIPSPEMRRKWDTEYDRMHINDGTMFGHLALCAAYDRCEDWLEEVLEYLRGNVEWVRGFLATELPQVRVCGPQEGTYLMWLDFRELMGSLTPAEANEVQSTAPVQGKDFSAPQPPLGGADDLRCKSGSHKRLMDWLAREAGLGLNSGSDFGREGVGWARLNAATSRAVLERAMGQLRDAVARL